MIVTTVCTTVSVVALPTPAAPPVTFSPLWQAIKPRIVPKTIYLTRPLRKSLEDTCCSVLST